MNQANDQISGNLRGSLFMLLAMASFIIGDTLMKKISTDLPLAQILVIRGAFSIVLFAILAIWLGHLRELKTILQPAFLLRLAGEVIATLFFLTALFNMPIANASAIMQALPLTVTVGAALFLGEPFGWRRLFAILIGFLGVVLIVRPGLEGFTIYSLYCVGAVVGTTIRDLATRKLPKDIPSMFVSLVTTVVIFIIGLTMSLFVTWNPVKTSDIVTLGTASIFLMTGIFTIISAMRMGEVAVVTPFRYSVLIFAVIIGIFVFDEIPDSLTILGSVIVVLSGLYTFYRENKISRQANKLGTSNGT